MAKYLPLPNGASLKVPDDMTYEEAMAKAKERFPELFAEKTARDTTGFKAAAAAGIERLKGEAALTAGKLGLMPTEEAEAYREARERAAQERFTPTEEGWTEAPWQKFKETLGGSIPYMAAPAAVAGLAALAAPAPVRAAVSAAGAFGAGAGQFTGTNLARQMETGKTLEETSLGAAVGAAIPQAALDTAAMALMPGIGKLFGSVGTKLTAEQAKAIASQTLGRTLADYAAKTGTAMGREGFTETVQQVLERAQAGLSITDPEARKEYIDSFIGGAALAGAGAPVGRAFERAGARDLAERAGREERRAAQVEAAAQQTQAEQEAAAAEEQRRNDPDYAIKLGEQYDTLLAEFKAKRSTLKKPGKDATPVEKAEYADAQNEVKALNEQLKDLTPEYRRTKPLREQTLVERAEEQRRAALTPEDFLLEQSGEIPTYTPSGKPVPEVSMEGIPMPTPSPAEERARAAKEETVRAAERPAQYAAERIQLAQEQLINPTGAELIDYLLQDPYMAQRVVETRTPLPGLSASESSLIRNSLASQLKKLSKAELEQRQTELKAQVPGRVEGNPLEQFLSDQDMLDVARQEGMTESEIADIERIARMPREVVEQGDLFGEQRVGQTAGVQQRVTVAEKLDELNRQLQIAYVQRNADRGAQYRETIRGLVEQIRDLQSKMQLPTAGELGAETAGLQEQLGRFPQALEQQRQAQAEVEKNLRGLATGKADEQNQMVLENLVAGIRAVRPDLRPETITQIEQQAQPVLDMVRRYGADAVPDALQQLDAISQRWRAGTERGQTFTRTGVPTTTSVDMLREQMDRAFAQNDISTRTERRERYSAPDMALLNQIADNFNAFVASPDRRNLAGEWLNRLTTTGVSSPEMTRDLQNELALLEEGKRSETETPMRQTAFGLATKPTNRAVQLELPVGLLPEAVRGEARTTVEGGKAVFTEPGEMAAPAQKATTFDTAQEFQKYLASDGLKQLRQEAGLTKDTASRIHQQTEEFRKKYENILKAARAQITALNERKQALEKLKGQEQRTAKELLADAQIRLNNVQARLDAELQDLQIAYLEADLQAGQSAADAAAISQRIADNVAKFQQADAAAVAAAQTTADAKAALAKIMQQPVNKKSFSAMRKAQQAVVAALREQRSASANVPRMVAFINTDLELQLQLAEALDKKEADARALVEAGQALRTEAAKQKRRQLYKKEFLTAQKGLAAALEISGPELSKITGSIDTELAQIEQDLIKAGAAAREAEGKLAPKEAPKSVFEQKLAEIKIEPLTRAEQDAIAERDKAKLQAFQNMTARLAAIPGTRIDFSKRQQMLESFNAHADQAAQLDQDIADVDTAIEEMEIAREIATDALADDTAGYTPTQKEQFQARAKQANERIEQLTAYGKRLQAQKEGMQKAYEKAVLATSSDPEIYQQVTKDLDARVEKLTKDIKENKERIAKGETKRGKKAETKTLKQARKRLANYERELKRVEALRSNRLGIKRIDALTGEAVAGQIAAEKRAEQGRPEPQKRVDIATQEQIDAENERAQLYSDRTARLLELQKAQSALEAAKPPKTEVKKAERAERLRKLQEDINKQVDLVNEVRPRGVGKVTAAARVQSSAPGKFRTGTAESKETAGVTKQPIVEKREVAAPTVSAATQEANEFAERLEKARTAQERENLILAKTLDERQQLIEAANNNVLTMRRRIAALEAELETPALKNSKSVTAADHVKQIRKELDGTPVDIQDVETTGLRTMLKKAEGQLQKLSSEITKANEIEADRALDMLGTEMGVGPVEEDLYDIDLGDAAYRTTTKTGPSMAAQAVDRLAKRIVAEWKNAPQIVVVNTERDLPVRILNQVERDNMWGKLPGLYDPKSKKVYLVASNLHDPTDVIATIAHEAAGHFGLQTMLGASYAPMMQNIYANNANVRKQAQAKMKANKNLSQNVAVEEVLADMAEGELSPIERTILQRVIDGIRNFFRKLMGRDLVMTDNQVRQVVANARKFVIQGGSVGDGKAQTEEATYRTAAAAPNALTDLAGKISSEPKTFRQKLAGLTALEAEQTGVDMRAGLREALKAGAAGLGDEKLFTQTMYNVLKADQKMPLTYTVMSRGPLELYKDEKGLYGVRSTNKNSAVDVFEAINELPYGDSKQKMAMAQAYLVAQRALNKGVEKLDIGALGIKESDLQAAIAAANADPALGKALEKVRTIYNAYNKGMIDFMAQTGAITKAQAEKLNAGKDYVPFYRVDANGNANLVFDSGTMVSIGDIRRQPYLAELKGGETKLLPLDEAIPRNTILLTDKALTNMAVKSVAYGLQAIGKGSGPIDPKTGKPTNKMAIHSGKGPADPGVIKFNQEPDPNDPKDTGERWVKVDTEGTMAEGVPTALLVKSLEGAHMPLPAFLKLAGSAADMLRAGVTRTPLYIARQLLREPMAAAFTGGLNYNTFTAVIKGGSNFVKMMRGNSEAEAKLLEKGLIQSGIFAGDVDDMGKFAMQIVKGDQAAYEKVFAAMDRVAIKADSSTRALVYENALANGLSEVEADMATMESMNFYKRGTAPMVQYASRLIPFFNAQIQGLNVLAKAVRGRMPFEERQRIQRKFFNNAVLLMATGVIYAMAMEDDETWRNARPRDKMSNFFLPIPGTDEMLKLPIPFEAGYFYSLAVAAVDGMREQTDNKAQWVALKDLFLNSIPGASSMFVPQIFKPIAEVWTNKNFLSGAPIESLRLQGLRPEERYNATTTELAKTLSAALPILSPIQIEHIVRGYFGVLPLVAVAGANSLFEREGTGEKPEKRLSELPLVGTTFQKKFGGADADVVFEAAKDTMEARNTLNKLVSEGRREEAVAFRAENRVELAMATAAGQYRQLVGRINADLRRTQERSDLTAAEKRQRIDRLEEAKQQAAARFLDVRRRAEASLGG